MIGPTFALLLFLHPVQSNYWLEASALPEAGIHSGFIINGIDFEGAVGTGYQALRAGVTIPAAPGYGTSRAEVEHRWDRAGEHMNWRLHWPLSQKRGLWVTEEFALTHVVNWGIVTPENKDTGQVAESQGRRQRFYLSWYRKHMMARFGFTERGEEVGLSLSATW